MYEQIKTSVARFIKLEKVEFEYFQSLLQVKQVGKKELILRAGQVCRHIYFVNSGCIRYFYEVDGQEHTAQFFFENGWYTDYGSFLSGQPTDSSVAAIEKTELLALEKSNLEKLYHEIPKFERFGRLMAENAYLGIRHRTKSLTNLSAEARYLHLIKERPKIFERVPQHYIASYLGIKPPSLSRIRKRISSGSGS